MNSERPVRLLLCLALYLGLCPAAMAGPLEDGRAAHMRGDFAAALDAWRPLAEAGVSDAQYNLATMYILGTGVPQDNAEALKWYRRAAENGSADAQIKVGAMYDVGMGSGQDHVQAVTWFQRAANQGHAAAQLALATKYGSGEGAPQDLILAYMWADLAARPSTQLWIVPVSSERVQKMRQLLTGMMTAEQLAEAERRAREWVAKPER